MTAAAEVVWRVPDWVEREVDLVTPRHGDEAKVQVAVEIARRNIEHGGGPFGAVVVDAASGSIIAVGANWVVQQRSSLLHAEIAAIAFAQARLGSHSLASGAYELVASSEPCVQCLGATVWSGVRRLLCGATTADAEAIGFDEGPRREDWVEQLERRGIGVTLGVLRTEAREVLLAYHARGGPIYNAFGS